MKQDFWKIISTATRILKKIYTEFFDRAFQYDGRSDEMVGEEEEEEDIFKKR